MNTVHEIHGEVNLVTKEEWYKQLFEHLEASKFRRSFHLKQKDIDYINEKGLDVIMGVVDNASDENNENTRRKATVVPIKIEYV